MLRVFSRLLAAAIIACLATIACAAVNDSGVKVDWSYKGDTSPENWGMLDEAFEICDTGKLQSPVNIGRKKTNIKYDLTEMYKPSPLFIGKDLPTKININHQREIVNTGHGLQINFHGKPKETISYGGKTYELIQFHFHTPSETAFHKQVYPLEIDFVHQGKNGHVAVAVVLVKKGKANPVLDKMLRHVPTEKHHEHTVSSITINPAGLLPSDKSYYSYKGSLTTPPCTEGLDWIVFPKAITASPGQIASIRRADGGDNARPIQALNGRILYNAVK